MKNIELLVINNVMLQVVFDGTPYAVKVVWSRGKAGERTIIIS
ncbi:hypothetical protein [Enterococcus faecalis]